MIIDNNTAKAMNESMEAAADEATELSEEDFKSIHKDDTDSETEKSGVTVEYIIQKMDEIRTDNAHIFEAMKDISSMSVKSNNGLPEAERAKAIATIVQCRETTNQKLLSMYEKMYDNIVPEKVHRMSEDKVQLLEHLISVAETNENESVAIDLFAKISGILKNS